MRTLKLAFLAGMGLLTLSACSNTFGAAPMAPDQPYTVSRDGHFVGSSQQYQDYSTNTRQNPDTANSGQNW